MLSPTVRCAATRVTAMAALVKRTLNCCRAPSRARATERRAGRGTAWVDAQHHERVAEHVVVELFPAWGGDYGDGQCHVAVPRRSRSPTSTWCSACAGDIERGQHQEAGRAAGDPVGPVRPEERAVAAVVEDDEHAHEERGGDDRQRGEPPTRTRGGRARSSRRTRTKIGDEGQQDLDPRPAAAGGPNGSTSARGGTSGAPWSVWDRSDRFNLQGTWSRPPVPARLLFDRLRPERRRVAGNGRLAGAMDEGHAKSSSALDQFPENTEPGFVHAVDQTGGATRLFIRGHRQASRRQRPFTGGDPRRLGPALAIPIAVMARARPSSSPRASCSLRLARARPPEPRPVRATRTLPSRGRRARLAALRFRRAPVERLDRPGRHRGGAAVARPAAGDTRRHGGRLADRPARRAGEGQHALRLCRDDDLTARRSPSTRATVRSSEHMPAGYPSWAGSYWMTMATLVADPGPEFVYAASPDGRVRKLRLPTDGRSGARAGRRSSPSATRSPRR